MHYRKNCTWEALERTPQAEVRSKSESEKTPSSPKSSSMKPPMAPPEKTASNVGQVTGHEKGMQSLSSSSSAVVESWPDLMTKFAERSIDFMTFVKIDEFAKTMLAICQNGMEIA